MPRRGYRFIAPVTESADEERGRAKDTAPRRENYVRKLTVSVLAGLFGGALLLALFLGFDIAMRWARDPQLLHLVGERRPLEAQASCRSTSTPDNPLGERGNWIVGFGTVVSFAAGSLFTARLAHLREVRADSNRVFELMIYHTVPGKMPALESSFHDVAKLQTKYNLNVVGYWVPNADPAWKNRFIYLVVHPSREAAEANCVRFMPIRSFCLTGSPRSL